MVFTRCVRGYSWPFNYRLLLIMKLAIFLTLGLAFNALAEANAQKITLNVKNAPLGEVMREFQKQQGCSFLFHGKHLSDIRVDAQLRQVEFAEAMDMILTDRGLDWSLDDGIVTITKRHSLPSNSEHILQQRTITGKVTDEQGNPLEGVTVTIKGTSSAVTTDANGDYRITVSQRGGTLVFTIVGFGSAERMIGDLSMLDVAMTASVSDLNEVVVVGYGEVKKRDITGSVASIKQSDLKAQPINSFDQALQGRVAGVQITQASNAPGGGITIRVRGGNSISASNDPLYVIDGFPVTNPAPASGASHSAIFANPLASINPNDVESIEVLKDASATAIYGSRGANGVVLVTTKRGKEGKAIVEFESYYGIQQITKTLDVINAEQHTMLKNEQLRNLGYDERYGPGLLYPDPSEYGEGTNWQNEIFRTSSIQNHQLSFSGGNERTKYLISGNYFGQEGIVMASNFDRYTTRLNIDSRLSDRVNVGTSFTISRTINNSVNEVGGNGLVGLALRYSPANPIFADDGSYQLLNVGPGSGFSAIANPVAVAKTTTNVLITDRVLANVFADVAIAKGLVAKFSVGTDLFNSKRDIFYSPETLLGNNVNGFGSNGNTNNLNLLNENTITYKKTINGHDFDLLAGITFQSNREDRTYMEAQDFPNFTLGANNLGMANTPLPPRGTVQEWGLNSYLSRINYRFKDRYLFTITGRVDGSSRFGVRNKYAFFPSGAFAWRISDEDFLRDSKSLSDLKLRISYGSTGNDGIGLYNSLSQYTTARTVFNDIEVLTNEAARVANPDLKWEKTNQFNVGIDVGFIKNRFLFTIDYYEKITSDLLLNVQLPATTGFTSVIRNIGSLRNRGVEFSLNTVNTTGKLKWTTNGNISFNRNKVLRLADAEELIVSSGFNTLIVKENEPLGSFFGNVFDGIWQSQEEIANAGEVARAGDLPGALRFRDLNGDGVFNEAADRTILGNGLPDFFYGITNHFNYGRFDLSLFVQGVYGNQIYNHTRSTLEQGDPAHLLLREVYERAWRPDRPSNRYSSMRQWRWPNTTSNFVEDGSFVRLKNVTFGYSQPINSKFLKSTRIYISGQNLITISKYSGFDPEVNSNFDDNVSYGVDSYAYPLARTFMLGATFQF